MKELKIHDKKKFEKKEKVDEKEKKLIRKKEKFEKRIKTLNLKIFLMC